MPTEAPCIRYLYGHDLHRHPELALSMFRHRRRQFVDRLGWPLDVDEEGRETDAYDDLNPLYAIWEPRPGVHGASSRFLPSLGRTMVGDHFAHLLPDGNAPVSPLIWESSRFCTSPERDPRAVAAIVLAHGELMRRCRLVSYIGVLDPAMERIHGRINPPEILGRGEAHGGPVAVALWRMKEDAWEPTLRTVGVDRETSRRWLTDSLRQTSRMEVPA